MRWEDFRQSGNIEDRRGMGGAVGGGLSIGAIVVLGLLGWAFGIDPRVLIEQIEGGGMPPQTRTAAPGARPGQTGVPGNDRTAQFVSAVLAQTEDVWKVVLPQQRQVRYQEPTLVLFSGATQSGCGFAQAQMGPFYCPSDRKVYIDLDFLAQMQRQLRAGGDFAFAYVIAHEVGHHVQNLLGILPRVQQGQRGDRGAGDGRAGSNASLVRMELMADCLAGVWAYHAEAKWRILEQGDIEEALNAAAAVGDDRLQRARQGRVVPDSFTHGSSEQRVRWFSAGLKSGSVKACDTFAQRP